MHLVALAWIYVVLMMAVAEALSPQGTLLGAFLSFLLYGVLPLSIVLHVLGAPMRRRARRRAQAESAAHEDRCGEAAGAPVASEREKA